MKFSKYNLFFPWEDGNQILFNTLTGDCFLVSEDEKNLITENQQNELPGELRKEFVKRGILIENEVDELKYFEYYHNKHKYDYRTLTYTILLTWACNLRCVYCYEGAGEEKKYSMTRETADHVIEYIKNESIVKNAKNISIMLFGGEPLVNYSIGEYIIETINDFCEKTGRTFTTSIVTNGTLINKKIVQSLAKNHCKYIQVTLDGTKEIHDTRRIGKNGEGTFDKIIQNLLLLKEYKNEMAIIIRVNVDKTNVEQIPRLLEYLKEKNLNDLHIDFGIVRGGTEACSSYEDNCYVEEEIGLLLGKLWEKSKEDGFDPRIRPYRKWTYCGLNCDNNLTIEPNGDVYKCWEHVGEIDHKIGSVGENGQLKNLSYNFYKWITRNPLNIEECRKCVYLPACGGGCGAVSYNKEQKYEASGCFKIKGTVEEEVKNYIMAMLKYDKK